MFWWLYEIVFWMVLLLAGPYYLSRMRHRGGYAQDFGERFGFLNRSKREALRGLKPIWIHGVSVGEVDLALHLIESIRNKTDVKIVLSTTTSTGHALALQKLPPDISIFYYPLDSQFCFVPLHRLLHPRAFILIEAELWPNHLNYCARKGVPLFLLNARLSKRFLPRYRRAQQLFRPAFRAFRGVTTQSAEDSAILAELGFPASGIKMLGSVKYDTALRHGASGTSPLLQQLAFYGTRPCWVAGSTHAGEEAIVCEAFARLKSLHPDLWLVVAPRHAERSDEIEKIFLAQGMRCTRRSALASSVEKTDIVLLDTTGELKFVYQRASVVFVGKSLTGHGGQNILEPAASGKPIVFGPHMENFEHIAHDFLKAGAAIQVKTPQELESKIGEILSSPQIASQLGAKASGLVQAQRGVLDRTVEFVLQRL